MVSNIMQTNAWTGGRFADVERNVAITALPLYHIFSLNGNCLLMMYLGGENVLIANPRDLQGFVREMSALSLHLRHGRQHDVCVATRDAGVRFY